MVGHAIDQMKEAGRRRDVEDDDDEPMSPLSFALTGGIIGFLLASVLYSASNWRRISEKRSNES